MFKVVFLNEVGLKLSSPSLNHMRTGQKFHLFAALGRSSDCDPELVTSLGIEMELGFFIAIGIPQQQSKLFNLTLL